MVTEALDDRRTIYAIDRLNDAGTVRTDYVVTSVLVTSSGDDDRVVVYNRGANAGHLFLRKGDGAAFAKKLLEGA